MNDVELTADFNIKDANLINVDEMPHKINQKAFILKVQKTQDGSSLFKGRFDFNLFKLIRDKEMQIHLCKSLCFDLTPVIFKLRIVHYSLTLIIESCLTPKRRILLLVFILSTISKSILLKYCY